MNDQLPLINCPSSSARQSEGFVNLRSWVQIPPRAHIANEVKTTNFDQNVDGYLGGQSAKNYRVLLLIRNSETLIKTVVQTEYIIPPDTIGTNSTLANSLIRAMIALNQRLSIP